MKGARGRLSAIPLGLPGQLLPIQAAALHTYVEYIAALCTLVVKVPLGPALRSSQGKELFPWNKKEEKVEHVGTFAHCSSSDLTAFCGEGEGFHFHKVFCAVGPGKESYVGTVLLWGTVYNFDKDPSSLGGAEEIAE